jgi:hypothetical protein
MKLAVALVVAGLLVFWVASAMAMEEEIVGTVIKKGDSYALLAPNAEYIVVGKNLDKYIGDTVAATGDVLVGAEFDTIHIDSVQVVSHKDLITPELESSSTRP